MKLKFIYIASLVWILLGCVSSKQYDQAWLSDADTLYAPKYASGFALYKVEGGSVLQVKNPWQGANGVDKWVFMSRNGTAAPSGFEGEIINTPIKRAICMSSSYVSFLEALGSKDVINGISGTNYIYSPRIRNKIKNGEIHEVGYDNSINYELLVSLRPDVIFVYGVSGENSALTSKLRELGLKIVYIGEYLENSPLGRSEWIIALSEFVDKRDMAQILFDDIALQYNAALKLAAQSSTRPKVMLNAPWRDSWFIPGDRSYMVKLITDAGGDYVCKGVDSDQSRPISTENAFIKASQSDIWLNPGDANTIAELKTTNPNFGTIPPVISGRVFNNNARKSEGGGSDFWESGTLYPHLILRDMVRIIHPELDTENALIYFKQLPE